MPMFVFLMFVGAALSWLLLFSGFIPTGKLSNRPPKDTSDAMLKDEEDEKIEDKEEKQFMRKDGLVGVIVLMIIIFGGVIPGFSCTSCVPTGYVRVAYNMNDGVDGEVLSQSWHLVAPTGKVITYSIGLEQSYPTSEEKGDSPNDESFSIPTPDGKIVRISLEFSYRFDKKCAAETFTTFKGKSEEQIKDIFIRSKITAWTQEVSANYPITDIFGGRHTEINTELNTCLRDKSGKYGIITNTVSLIDISVDDEVTATTQKKVTVQQELELANIEAQTAKVQAEKDRQATEINAGKQITDVSAKTEVTCIEAEAEAQTNRKIATSLTPNLIGRIEYERWNGEPPTVLGSRAVVSINGADRSEDMNERQGS